MSFVNALGDIHNIINNAITWLDNDHAKKKNMNNYNLDKISNSNIVSPYLDHKHTG